MKPKKLSPTELDELNSKRCDEILSQYYPADFLFKIIRVNLQLRMKTSRVTDTRLKKMLNKSKGSFTILVNNTNTHHIRIDVFKFINSIWLYCKEANKSFYEVTDDEVSLAAMVYF